MRTIKIKYQDMTSGTLFNFIKRNNMTINDSIYAEIINTKILKSDEIESVTNCEIDSIEKNIQVFNVKLINPIFENLELTLFREFIDFNMLENYMAYYDMLENDPLNFLSDEIWKQILKDFLFYKKEIYEMMYLIVLNDEKIEKFNNLFCYIIQECLNKNENISLYRYCKNYAKILELNEKKSGLFYHCAGLFYQKMGKIIAAKKNFIIAFIDDLIWFDETTALNSNAACVLKVAFNFNSNDIIFTKTQNIVSKYKNFTPSMIYYYFDTLIMNL